MVKPNDVPAVMVDVFGTHERSRTSTCVEDKGNEHNDGPTAVLDRLSAMIEAGPSNDWESRDGDGEGRMTRGTHGS